MTSSAAKSSKKLKSQRSKGSDVPIQSERSEKGETSNPANVIEYRLSDQQFVKLGWTLKPSKRFARKIIQYQTQMAKPHVDWFTLYDDTGTKYYSDLKTPFVVFHSDNSGEVFYPNGRLAIRVNRPKKRMYYLYTVFTPGGKNIEGYLCEPQIIAVFDGLGNGIVLNENNDTRLTYNQIGGICFDNPRAQSFAWTWSLRRVEPKIEAIYTDVSAARFEKQLQLIEVKSIKSLGSAKTPKTGKSQEKKEKTPITIQPEDKSPPDGNDIEDIFEKSKKDILAPIKIICLRLNEYLSLRIVDRRNISLTFFSRTRSIRIELGTILNTKKPISSHSVDSSAGILGILKSRFEFEESNESFDPNNIELSKLYIRTPTVFKG